MAGFSSITYYNISMLNNDSTFNSTIYGNNGLNLTYSWNTSSFNSGWFYVKVEAYDNNSRSAYGLSNIFFIDNIKPTLTIIAPANSQSFYAYNVNISCNITDNLAVKNITLNIYNTTDLIFSASNTSYIINSNYSFPSRTATYNFNCSGYDVVDNLNFTSTYNLTILNPSPTVTLVYPGNGTSQPYTNVTMIIYVTDNNSETITATFYNSTDNLNFSSLGTNSTLQSGNLSMYFSSLALDSTYYWYANVSDGYNSVLLNNFILLVLIV